MPSTDNNNAKVSFLKAAREAKGLTLDIVHEATKIPLDALKAIEEGYSVRLLSPFYYRGFIKIYAEFLGLNVDEVFARYGLEAAPKTAASLSQTVRPREAQQPNIVLEQAQEWLSVAFNPKNRKKILKIIGFLAALFILFKIAGCIGAHIQTVPKDKKAAAHAKAQEKKIHPPPMREEREASPQVPNDVLKAKNENHKAQLAVRASKDTWIQVKADGKIVFQMTMKKGTMESWSARDRIELSGKNINELDIEVNGKHIGSLGRVERHAKKVMITKEGLTVKK